MKKILRFFKKNIATALLSAITISVMFNIGGRLINTLTRVEILLERDSLALLTLEAEMVDARCADDVDVKVSEWREKKFVVQIASLYSVASNPTDREKLRDRVFSEEVYKTLISHAILR